jgi:hypothetical protein
MAKLPDTTRHPAKEGIQCYGVSIHHQFSEILDHPLARMIAVVI